jgi:hypothetical protein
MPPRDEVPEFNPNPDAGSIPGFHSGVWPGDRPGELGKIMHDDNDPVHTHLHRHPDGLTISTYYPDGSIEGFNFNTGLQERG